MQFRPMLVACVPLLLAGLVTGCGKKEETPPVSPGAKETAPPQSTLDAAKKVADTAQKTVAQASAQAQGLIDQAKTLINEKKVQDASGVVQKLAGMTLSTEQQKLAGDLKAQVAQLAGQIEKGLADLKSLVAEKKYSEATTMITKLKDFQLTPDQQKVFDGLKAQIQAALGSKATGESTKALGGLLDGKK